MVRRRRAEVKPVQMVLQAEMHRLPVKVAKGARCGPTQEPEVYKHREALVTGASNLSIDGPHPLPRRPDHSTT